MQPSKLTLTPIRPRKPDQQKSGSKSNSIFQTYQNITR